MSIPLIILYYGDNAGALKTLAEPYIIAIILPTSLIFVVLVVIYIGGLLFRPTTYKAPADVFLTSFIAAAVVFLVVHVEQQVEDDPWGLDFVWRRYRKAAKIARQIAGHEIEALEAEIDRNRVSYQAAEEVEELESTTSDNSYGAGSLPAGNYVGGNVVETVESHKARTNTDMKDKDV